ncbi:hypothetical protein H8959_003747, partial [Pygathrix nigripes]
ESKRPIISKMPAWIFPCHPLDEQTYHMALNAATFPKNATWIGPLCSDSPRGKELYFRDICDSLSFCHPGAISDGAHVQ